MKSAIAFSDEIDDLKKASEELSSTIKEKLVFEKATLGVVFCDADVDVAELGRRLHESLGIDVLGVTTTASIERNSGYHDMGIVLSVVTSDDVSIVTGKTGVLTPDNFEQQIRDAYTQAEARLGNSPTFIYIGAPYIANITSDKYMFALDALANSIPIFGGVATDHYDLQYQKTFLNGEAGAESMVFALFSGNIKPVFAMEHEFGGKTLSKGVVTRSSGNQVEKIGDCTFVEYLSEITPVPNEETVIFHFQSTPFVLEMPDYEQSEQPIVRALCTINHETGAGGFLSDMPEGSVLSINVLQRDNLRGSCCMTLSRLMDQMRENEDYCYSMVFISTCNARHLLMSETKNMEANILAETLSDLDPDLNVAGFYGFGEICPTAVKGSGKAKNRFHNVSFAVCAI